MDRLSTDPRYQGLAVFRVDFDSSKALLRQWRVTGQSTLLAFKGKSETSRSIGQTGEAAIRRIFEAAR